MREDYRWILEQTFKRVGLDEDAERRFRDILLEAEGQFPEPVLSETVSTGKVLLPLHIDTDALREKIMPLLRVQIEEYQKKLEEQAINIILHQEGPISTFIEIENDEGAGVGVGEYLPQKGKYSRLRITAANIISMENMS